MVSSSPAIRAALGATPKGADFPLSFVELVPGGEQLGVAQIINWLFPLLVCWSPIWLPWNKGPVGLADYLNPKDGDLVNLTSETHLKSYQNVLG